MPASTRFPEAEPLRNINAKTKGFMSGIFQQVVYELGIVQYRSSAYHPQSQGVLERWHQTLKNMMRIYCSKTEKD